jgi:HEAT repeats
MIASEKLRAQVDSLVIPDRAAAAGNVDREAIARTLEAIRQGGADSIVGLVEMLVEPGKGDDSKARYALHALAVQVGGLRDDKQRRAFAEALASTLEGKRPRTVLAFVVRQLQVVGRQEVAAALGKLLVDEELCEPAAQALLAIKTGAVEQFRAALPKTAGKARLTTIHALGTLRDLQSAGVLKKLVTDRDQDVRLTAAWALANAGDATSVDLLIKASGAEGFERIKATSACLLLAERLLAAGKKAEAERLYKHLRDSRTDPGEQHIRDAAIRGLVNAK